MDGTIVDTEPYWIEAEHALVTAHGGQWSHEKAMQLVGQSLVFSAGILQEAGVRLERREIIDILTAHVIRQVRDSVPWRPGARELLEELHTAGIRCCPRDHVRGAAGAGDRRPACPGPTSISWSPATPSRRASRIPRPT